DWLAGRWQRTQSTETKRVELPSGKQLKSTGKTEAKVQERFGTFMDRDGVIWQVFTPQRASGEVDRGNVLDYHKVNRYNMEILDDKTVLVEVTASHMVVSKDKRLIVQSYQDEELNTYTRTKDGRAVTDSSVKVFDQMGRPIFLTRSVSDVVKIEPFINQASGAGSR
ncbi:MAG: hypothetical protein K8F91_08975, partial [Candidatus Obscuribacterales bacterium]|nr:hypothetical protein [Candidatus Obscuribacterales bacterium]